MAPYFNIDLTVDLYSSTIERAPELKRLCDFLEIFALSVSFRINVHTSNIIASSQFILHHCYTAIVEFEICSAF